ncbi:hypothetical protein Mkiyose1665_26430 [Mycobacterium kiyosense]|uniref:Low molecular weight antigen MTB12-like C-terminal domain-containing protein n=2 Tax=Mycobacteriaceae TaxID=1762 RepID=A0A9P3UXA8_9MYCO|nr:hypothetical protein IWGMT90018_22280 [Mycobacterium kiyosense]BDE14925.1 hypothetical protein MKCMC460_37850 [Mycobacterium sp. 20KCMC460]GLB82298.1 hypothetical protein SRL2020028_15540 [Mycobacterium kiyosense]GLB89349.1 hypothetical protein SRL2020130_21660 [Mycobacterium kiyosense]GLB96002.1 hypothetical protein SRL2020226_27780 [Mycobacterium kiyosense]
MKSIAVSVAALAAVGGAAALGSGASGVPLAAQVQLASAGAPLPLDPAPSPTPSPAPDQNVPTADQITSILTNLSDPGVSYHTKDSLVEGGIGSGEGHVMDHELRKAYRNGQLPLSFAVTNIQSNGPTTATADVAVSGPKLPAPVTKNLMFVNQNGNWVLSSPSATELVQAVSGL